MKHSWEILLLATRIERAALRNILSHVTARYKKEVAPTMPFRSEAQDALYNEELQGQKMDALHATVQTATSLRLVHEANRAQRDIEIINAGRKKLLKGCLDAVVYREEKLDRKVYAMEKTPQ